VRHHKIRSARNPGPGDGRINHIIDPVIYPVALDKYGRIAYTDHEGQQRSFEPTLGGIWGFDENTSGVTNKTWDFDWFALAQMLREYSTGALPEGATRKNCGIVFVVRDGLLRMGASEVGAYPQEGSESSMSPETAAQILKLSLRDR
jgi:hypothetical protein